MTFRDTLARFRLALGIRYEGPERRVAQAPRRLSARQQYDKDRRACFPADAMDRVTARTAALALELNRAEEVAELAASPHSADRKAAQAGGYPF